MARLALTICAVLALAACASSPPPPVEVPVPQRLEPPPELMVAIPPPGRIFTAPGVSSVACVDPAGRDALVGYVDALRQRGDAWRAWVGP
ncbi:hypothetical protein [Azospirillum cavernae]|uniref:hypothetical protein n=1 Tax=Azospirillum cavernae TaxID=2320860 RepID=UPI000E6D1895|nr:hypothetical protein [Azospirillum cavernae]